MSTVRDSSPYPAGAPAGLADSLFVAGRVLLASLFVVSGVRKVLFWSPTVAYFGKIGLPWPELLLPLVVLLEVVGGLALAFGWHARIVALALAAFTLVAGFVAHAFWSVDAAQYGNQFNHLWKNVSIAGGLLCVSALSTARRTAAGD